MGANCVAEKLVSWAYKAGHRGIELRAQSIIPHGVFFWKSSQKVRGIGKPSQDAVLFFCWKRCCALNAHLLSTQVISRCTSASLRLKLEFSSLAVLLTLYKIYIYHYSSMHMYIHACSCTQTDILGSLKLPKVMKCSMVLSPSISLL